MLGSGAHGMGHGTRNKPSRSKHDCQLGQRMCTVMLTRVGLSLSRPPGGRSRGPVNSCVGTVRS